MTTRSVLGGKLFAAAFACALLAAPSSSSAEPSPNTTPTFQAGCLRFEDDSFQCGRFAFNESDPDNTYWEFAPGSPVIRGCLPTLNAAVILLGAEPNCLPSPSLQFVADPYADPATQP